ncbi:arrestin domain-containing protein [Xylariaceae sp. FL0594]|nr:arrestin domain-containing protein [Xylariaceae sp. FL0594]
MLPGDTPESVEGLYQTGITYLFKATIIRGKLAKNFHAYKRLRVIRTLAPAALELNHAMSVENLWPNKTEYSIIIPRKAVVFGTVVPIEMRFTPLLKGLEMGKITIRLIESQEFTVTGPSVATRTHKHDREVTMWHVEADNEKHWHDVIEETGQDGWVIKQDLQLPKKLSMCLQDCWVQGIKIRHKLRLSVALHNPDGHISELRATLPFTIFISPNMPLDEEGNLLAQEPVSQDAEVEGSMAPPGYGQHVLDQLYEDLESGIMTPGIQSGLNSPFYGQSRAGSTENLAGMVTSHSAPVTPAALTSRLQSMTLEEPHHGRFHSRYESGSGAITPHHHPRDGEHTFDFSQPHSPVLSRRNSEEHLAEHAGHATPPAHAEFPTLEQLSKVPSYTTATRAPLPRTQSFTNALSLPDYNTAMSAPGSPAHTPGNPMDTITEASATGASGVEAERPRSASGASRTHIHGFSFFPSHAAISGNDAERRLRVLQHRGTT